MPSRLGAQLTVLAVLTFPLVTPPARAALTADQRREISGLSTSLRKISNLFSRQQYQSSAESLAGLQERIQALAESGDAEVLKALEDVYAKLVRAHALLELEGVELPPLLELKPAEPMPAPGGASFVKDVAPMLVAKCGRCHVDQSRGDFNMADYPTLMRGSAAGVVIFAGDPVGSRLVEIIESEDMPRGGGRVTPEELTALKNWIAAGARFDGDNPQASLNLFATAGPSTTPAPAVVAATGNETISFARDIAPVLAANCNGCHVNPQNARGNLNMTTFPQLLRGGDSGPPVMPRQAADSLLVQRIKGEGGEARMPLDREPLADDVIAKIEQWITEGATFDGPNPDMEIGQVAALAKAANATHDQLSADRMALAQQNWQLGMAGGAYEAAETKNFYLVGNVGAATLEEYGAKSEELAPKVAAIFGAPPSEPLLKGRMTLFLFQQRYDYSEFGQMVEKRELPKEWRGHWNFTVVDAYGAMLPPRDDSYTLEGLVAQQLAGTYIASLNSPPRWFAEGSARVAAARLAPKDPRVKAWKDGLGAALAKMQRVDDFLTNKIPPEDADTVAYAFVGALMSNKNAKLYRQLLGGLREGHDFPRVFAAVYGADPTKVAEVWARTAGRR